jgi:hypothetical protein
MGTLRTCLSTNYGSYAGTEDGGRLKNRTIYTIK